ncbi:MAG: enoyl-CoA hydratase/isomerase family protein [Promethearchaeota archaeon]
MSDDDIVLYEVNRGVCTITLNRPPVHAFNLELQKRLNERLVQADNDDKAKCILLKSTGNKAFSAGIDIKIPVSEMTPEYRNELLKYGRATNQLMLLMEKPIICVVQGTAIGYGFELIMASDLRIFVERPFPDMFFRMPEIALSIYPSTGATILPLLSLGLTYAKSILLTSDNFGLKDLPPRFATRIFKPDDLEQGVKDFMKEFMSRKESFMYLIKSSLTMMNNKLIEKWFDLEDEGVTIAYEKKSSNEWKEVIKKLFEKY